MSRREVLKNFERYTDEIKERTDYGIENYRKGNFCITVRDKDGNPVKGKTIELDQKNHEFKYGANIFMLDELETTEKNEKYKEYFKEAFNMATLPFYWNDLEPIKGESRYEKGSKKIYRRPPIDLCMEFCEENGIEPREHALAYEGMFPDWAMNLPTPELKKELTRRFREISERYADRIHSIEVTNEMNWAINSRKRSAFYEDDEYVEWCFKEAEKYFPNNQLSINDFGVVEGNARNRDLYYMEIERAISKGARIDAIGIQFHMFHRVENELMKTELPYNPRHLFKILDRYSDFNVPLHLTEITIPAYTYDKEDEEIQAEIIRNLYTIWFSHKNVEQIIYWNLVDGYAAFAPMGDFNVGENYYRGGLLRFDLTPKPSYYVVRDLFKKVWHTKTTVTTDENGKAYFKGFYGDYVAKIDDKSYTIGAKKGLWVDINNDKQITINHTV